MEGLTFYGPPTDFKGLMTASRFEKPPGAIAKPVPQTGLIVRGTQIASESKRLANTIPCSFL